MSLFSELDVLKEIPGYQAIMKGVVKSLIQILIEQLSAHTGEESVILTASINDGTLSHLGSDSGKVFLEENDDIKTKFLGFCLQRHHRRKTSDVNPTLEGGIASGSPVPLHRVTPSRKVANQRRAGLSPSSPYSVNRHLASSSSTSAAACNFTNKPFIKSEDNYESETNNEDLLQDVVDQTVSSHDMAFDNSYSSESATVKTEPVDDEIEITGVDPGISVQPDQGESSFDSNQWFQNAVEGVEYHRTSAESATSVNMGEQSGMGKDLLYGSDPQQQGQGHAKLTCHICGQKFKANHNLQRHLFSHTGQKPFQCKKCSKSFSRKDNLKQHMVVHLRDPIPVSNTFLH